MDPQMATKAVLASIAKQLNRFLRFSRQDRFHQHTNISAHLQRCLAYGFSARTFLQPFFSNALPFQVFFFQKNHHLKPNNFRMLCPNPNGPSSVIHAFLAPSNMAKLLFSVAMTRKALIEACNCSALCPAFHS